MNYSKKIKLVAAAGYLAFGLGCLSTYGAIKYIPKEPEQLLKAHKLEQELNTPIKSVKLDDCESLINKVEQLNEEIKTTTNSPLYKEQSEEYKRKTRNHKFFLPLIMSCFFGVIISKIYKDILISDKRRSENFEEDRKRTEEFKKNYPEYFEPGDG